MEACAINLKFGEKSVDFNMNLNAMDFSGFERGQIYEPNMSGLFATILRSGDTVIDVGANVGWFTILSAALVGPEGRVYAFEPAPENSRSLEFHVQINEFKNVEVAKMAVSDMSGLADLYLNPYGNGGHSFYNMQEGRADLKQPTVIQVNKVSLDKHFEMIDLSKLRIIKVDTEGHDVRVLAGAREILSKVRPPYIFTELHGGISKFNDTQLDFFNMMREYGYYAFLLIDDLPVPMLIPPGMQIVSKNAANLLFAAPEDVGKLFKFICIGTANAATE